MINFGEHVNAERVLQDAWELFQRRGYLGVSMDEICQRCEITKPTLYYYFKNKENLFVEVLLRRLKGFHEEIERDGKLDERLAHIATTVFDSFKSDYSYLVRDLEHIKIAENVTRITDAFASEMFIPITQLMQAGVDERQLSGDAKFLAHLFMGIIESHIARADKYAMEDAILAKKLVTFFLKGARE